MSGEASDSAKARAEMYRSRVNTFTAAVSRLGIQKAKQEQEIVAIEQEIREIDECVAILQKATRDTKTFMNDLIRVVTEIDGSYAVSMASANEAIQSYISRMRGIVNSIDAKHGLGGNVSSVGAEQDNINDIMDIILKGVNTLDTSAQFLETLLRYSLASSLNISVQTADKLYIVKQGTYTIVKGSMNTGIGTRFLSSNLQNGSLPLATRTVQSIKSQNVLKTLGRVTLVAGGVIVAGNELLVENQDQSAARRVGNAGVEVGIYPAAALTGLKIGAAAGAAVGSVIPIAGTAVGAVVGAAVGVIAGVAASFVVDNAFDWIKVNEDQTLREWTKEKIGDATEGLAQGVSKVYHNAKKGIGNAISGVSNFFRNPSILWGG